ncbi:putative UDP-N-acetylglucosamine--peptide N-acetylglucosaminyltransferase SEC [Glycine soja]
MNQCLTLEPNHQQALTNLGNIYMEWNMVVVVVAAAAQYYKATLNVTTSGHVEDAVKSYKQALILRPDFSELTYNLLHTLQLEQIECRVNSAEREAKLLTEQLKHLI